MFETSAFESTNNVFECFANIQCKIKGKLMDWHPSFLWLKFMFAVIPLKSTALYFNPKCTFLPRPPISCLIFGGWPGVCFPRHTAVVFPRWANSISPTKMRSPHQGEMLGEKTKATLLGFFLVVGNGWMGSPWGCPDAWVIEIANIGGKH